MGPMEGAADFIAWLRERAQVIILSDTFMSSPSADAATRLSHNFLQPTGDWDKTAASSTINPATQPEEARGRRTEKPEFPGNGRRRRLQRHGHAGRSPRRFFFRPRTICRSEFPQFPVTKTYAELQEQFRKAGDLKA